MISELINMDWDALKKPWMKIALLENGVVEAAGDKDNPKVIEYHSATSLRAQSDSVPWCSAFVNWVMKKAGVAGTNNAMARSWLSWGKPCDFEPGCVVVLKRGTGWQGHVGFAVKKVGPVVWVYGGNQSDAVNVSKYPSWKVLGYRKI